MTHKLFQSFSIKWTCKKKFVGYLHCFEFLLLARFNLNYYSHTSVDRAGTTIYKL